LSSAAADALARCDRIVCWENNLQADKTELLKQKGVKKLALSEIVASTAENQVHESGERYSVPG
jgi:hypothetical protein